MFSKSFFLSNANNIPSMINPLGFSTSGGSNVSLSVETLNAIKTIQREYTFNMTSPDKYDNISQDFEKMLRLYGVVTASWKKTTSSNLKTLLNITREGLIGAFYIGGLSIENTDLISKNDDLTSQLNELLPRDTKIAFATNGFTANDKPFVLAPIFSYYINTYGMPNEGEGFNIDKLYACISILENLGVKPFD